LSVGNGILNDQMSRHTTFKFCLDPTVEQQQVLARHAGAARFAFNQCLRIVKTALSRRTTEPDIRVPWTGFDLINAFNGWKKAEDAGRVFTVRRDGVVEVVVAAHLIVEYPVTHRQPPPGHTAGQPHAPNGRINHCRRINSRLRSRTGLPRCLPQTAEPRYDGDDSSESDCSLA